jgi:uncharacterized iron-regulated membrane protein
LKHYPERLLKAVDRGFQATPVETKIAGRAIFIGDTFRSPMRWLMIVLAVSVCALLVASAGLGLHVWRQHRRPAAQAEAQIHEEPEIESEEAP